ncbi:MAG: zf-TFIIB domain-containing protein [Gemmatimonadetes bacterium]|nr:zf-TFIIB domain-containing protein [Gemmatimonadota bacterium]
MKPLETRYPCPVCLGAKMEKVRLPVKSLTGTGAPPGGKRHTAQAAAEAQSPILTLDHCPRCGGVWFEAGEVQHLRRVDPTLLWHQIVQREGVHMMQCHSCRTHIPRTADACPACRWHVELDCPVCDSPMRVSAQTGMQLDFCAHCRGVWFDHDELTEVWKMEVDALVKRRGSRAVGGRGERALDTAGDVLLLDVLLYDPFVMYYGIHAAGHVAGAAADVLAGAGSIEVIGEVAGAAGDVASGLFETVVEIIAGIFG